MTIEGERRIRVAPKRFSDEPEVVKFRKPRTVVVHPQQQCRKRPSPPPAEGELTAGVVNSFLQGCSRYFDNDAPPGSASDFALPAAWIRNYNRPPPYRKLTQNRYKPHHHRPVYCAEINSPVCTCSPATGCRLDCVNRLLFM